MITNFKKISDKWLKAFARNDMGYINISIDDLARLNDNMGLKLSFNFLVYGIIVYYNDDKVNVINGLKSLNIGY